VNNCIIFIMCHAITTMATLLYVPHMAARGGPILVVQHCAGEHVAIANIPREIPHGRDGRAFVSSGVAMLALMGLFGLRCPNRSPATRAANSLTVYNGASSQTTLASCSPSPHRRSDRAHTVSIY
jgi:cytochrome d ubiquinol oxidase subunit II